jgi:hypothetical protein
MSTSGKLLCSVEPTGKGPLAIGMTNTENKDAARQRKTGVSPDSLMLQLAPMSLIRKKAADSLQKAYRLMLLAF